MEAKTVPSLGQLLRASRSGFFWNQHLGCFVRARTGASAYVTTWSIALSGPGGLPLRADTNVSIGQDACIYDALVNAPAIERAAADLADAIKDNPSAQRIIEVCDHGETLDKGCVDCKRAGKKVL